MTSVMSKWFSLAMFRSVDDVNDLGENEISSQGFIQVEVSESKTIVPGHPSTRGARGPLGI